jgi:hypothetical protein
VPVLRALAAIPAPPIERLLAPADRVRSRLLRFFAPRARSLVVARDRRVALAASGLLLCALVSSSVIPMWLLALGPIVWGVPHIVSDVRYLVTRPGYHRRPWIMAAIGAGIIASGLGFGVRGALAGAGGALLLSRATPARRAAGIVVIGGLLALAQWAGWVADLVFAHAHNAVGVGLWWAWRRRQTRLHWLPLLLFAGGGAIILAGLTEPIVGWSHGFVAPWTGLTARSLALGLSPRPDGPIAVRLLMFYAFWQAAHYVVWLRLVPEDDRPSPTPRSYLQSYRALRADVGSVVLWIALLGAIAVALWAAVNVGQARNGYIQLAFFHGYLELAAVALLWGEARLGWDGPRAAAG